jgi:hypothetical protein
VRVCVCACCCECQVIASSHRQYFDESEKYWRERAKLASNVRGAAVAQVVGECTRECVRA